MKLFLSSILVLLFCVTCSVRSNPSPSVLARYKKFINQHVAAKMTANKCDSVINGRDISETGSSKCKETNTFILATTNYINPICDKAGVPYQGNPKLRISNKPFPIVNCKAKKEGKYLPNCVYNGKTTTVRIVIGCEEGFPVHYETAVLG